MMYPLLASGLLFILGIFLLNTRRARMKRLARSLGIRYDARVDTPLTSLASQHVRFLKRGLHQFSNVLTWNNSGAFIRVCEDRIFSSPLDKSPLATLMLATAEITRGTLPTFTLAVRTAQDTSAHPALPDACRQRYTLQAPPAFQLPKELIGLLQTGKPCYIESTPQALVYHEYRPLTIAEIQTMRFRVQQLVNLFKQVPPVPAQAPLAQPKTPAELQAEILLKLHTSTATSKPAAGANRVIYTVMLLMFLAVLCAIAWIALQHLPR